MDRKPKEDTEFEEIAYGEDILDSPPSKLLTENDIKSDESSWKNFPVYIICFFIALSGLTAIIQPLTTRLAKNPNLFEILNLYDYYHWSKSLSIGFGLFLILLSFNLFKRKKVAWALAFYSCLLSSIIHVLRNGNEYIASIKDHDLSFLVPSLTSLVPILTVVLLYKLRHKFTVRSEKGDLSNGIFVLLVSIPALVIYTSLGFWFLEIRDFGINFQLDESFIRAVKELCFIGNPDIVPQSKFATWYLKSIHLTEALTVSYAAFSLFRPIQYRLVTEPKEREIAKSLLDQYGTDALDNYKLLNDKSYYFNSDYSAFVAYTTVLDVAICLGEPVGQNSKLKTLVASFKSFCHENDWKLAFLQVKSDNLELFEACDLNVLKIGEDAIVDLAKFETKTVKSKSFKQPLKKLDKQGFRLERCVPPHTEQLISTVRSISDEWLSLPGRKERGFSLGWFDQEAIQNDVLYVLENDQGESFAFVNQVKSYAPNQVSIDMMRHRSRVPNGSMDYLFAKLLLDLKSQGFESFSLGLAALSGVGDKEGATKKEKAVHMIYEHMNRFFSYKGLRRYKSKFHPDWEDRYLIYEGTTATLIKTALAITRAGNILD